MENFVFPDEIKTKFMKTRLQKRMDSTSGLTSSTPMVKTHTLDPTPYQEQFVKTRYPRMYKNAFFGPLKACYGHKGLCTIWGRSHGFRKYP